MSHKKIGPDRFSRFDVYWIQTNKQTNRHPDRQAKFIYRRVNALINIGYKDGKERDEEGFNRRHMGWDRRDVWLEETQFARILITLLLTLG